MAEADSSFGGAVVWLCWCGCGRPGLEALHGLVAAACEADATATVAVAAVKARRKEVLPLFVLALVPLVTEVAGGGTLLLTSSASCSR